MGGLTENELKVVESNPLRDGLASFRATFRSRYQYSQNDNPAEAIDRYLSDKSDRSGQDLVFDLILALTVQSAARILPSKTNNGSLSVDLAFVYARLSSGQTDFKELTQLVEAVIAEAEDTEVWKSVYSLITQIIPSTPPQSGPPFAAPFNQTPWGFNTGNFIETSEYRDQVDVILKQELKPSLRIDVPDLFETFFACISQLDELVKRVFQLCQKEDTPLYTDAYGWVEWPRTAKENLVLKWLQDHMSRFIEWTNESSIHPPACRQIYQGPCTYLHGSTAKRKMDVGVCHAKEDVDKDGNPVPKWAQILVTGELKSNPVEDRQETAWIDLATYTREIFKLQDRRFVLGFTLCGSMMRLWHFDRSGSSGSCSFDINKDGLKFVKVMLGFYLMDDEQLGFDSTIKQSDGKRYIEITRNGQVERLVLVENLRRHGAIVGRATMCWKAYSDRDVLKELLIVKDSWQYEERPEEGELIKDATDKGVQNIARYYHHETVQVGGKNDDVITNVRRGLMKEYGRTTFRQKSFANLKAPALETFGQAVAGRTQSQSDSLKRSSSVAQTEQSQCKRPCSSRQSTDKGTPIHNRVHRRVITRDAGKAIERASSLIGVINGIIGAINGHESLFNADILHRDISTGNIMLTEQEDDGFLIDLDLAIKILDGKASGAPSKTGTKIFMAIGALLGQHHSFMHDLESFFWVLFWICIYRDRPINERKKVEEFENWNYKPVKELAQIKIGMVSEPNIFDAEVENFSPHCKPLVNCMQELWKVVFPGGKRRLHEDRELYSQMKAVLHRARDNLEARKAA